MKKLKRWIAAILVWEFVTLRSKDERFKAKVQSADGTAKIKVIANELFDFNKKLVEDIQSTNVQEMKEKALAWFTKEAELLEEKLTTRESEYASWSDEKLPIYLMWLESQFKKYEEKAVHRKEKLIWELDLEETIALFTKRIDSARTSLQNNKPLT